jgi:hypothetical protein
MLLTRNVFYNQRPARQFSLPGRGIFVFYRNETDVRFERIKCPGGICEDATREPRHEPPLAECHGLPIPDKQVETPSRLRVLPLAWLAHLEEQMKTLPRRSQRALIHICGTPQQPAFFAAACPISMIARSDGISKSRTPLPGSAST